MEKQQSGADEREKTERKNTLKVCIPYLVPEQLSKQINVCHMTYSGLFPTCQGNAKGSCHSFGDES